MITTRTPATKWRYDVGASPWNRSPERAMSPEGTTGTCAHSTPVAPSGLCGRFDLPIHGFAPVATACRPFGTGPTRCVGADEVEDDGVPFVEKEGGSDPRVSHSISRVRKLQTTIRDNMQMPGFALPEVGE